MNIKFARRAAMQPSPIFTQSSKVARMREAGQDIISLAIGESDDIDTPLHVKAAGIEAIESGKTKYTAIDGHNMLKQAICQKLLQENDLEYNPYQVIASSGAKQSIHNAMMCLLDEGDEAILIAPYWTSYLSNIKLTGATPVIIETDIKSNFKATAEQIEQSITANTKVIVINSPNNPSGQHYSNSELKKIAKVLLKHPTIVLISDDIYEQIYWGETGFQNILNVCPKLAGQTIVINGLSKSYSMTGWRIGYAAGPREIIEKMKSYQSQSTSCPCSISQYAAVEALDSNPKVISQAIATFKTRHDLLFNYLNAIEGCEILPAQGAYYLFPNVEKIITKLSLKDDVELAEKILEKSGVSVLPGSIFGLKNHLRITFVVAENKLNQAISRIDLILNPKETDQDANA
ncbi:pyridoxal phosphate-dependent aminotransferase [Gammaproteobacteria bacterium]|nr:pyridoxal phosphate-dependent aminotransferase [Gammaproteobacteria bacterium]